LGHSLEQLFRNCGKKFSVITVLALAEQTVSRIEFFHIKGYIHRDIKPDNFMSGRDMAQNIAYIIDYGLAKRYRDIDTKIHIPYRDGKKLTGTARYASINTHLGIEQSRRDDLECLGYTLLYFARGDLPWQNIKDKDKKSKYQKIGDKKMGTKITKLCADLPKAFTDYMNYCTQLGFEEKPDYTALKRMFHTALSEKTANKPYKLDWELRPMEDKSTSAVRQDSSDSGKGDELDRRATIEEREPMQSSTAVVCAPQKQNEQIGIKSKGLSCLDIRSIANARMNIEAPSPVAKFEAVLGRDIKRQPKSFPKVLENPTKEEIKYTPPESISIKANLGTNPQINNPSGIIQSEIPKTDGTLLGKYSSDIERLSPTNANSLNIYKESAPIISATLILTGNKDLDNVLPTQENTVISMPPNITEKDQDLKQIQESLKTQEKNYLTLPEQKEDGSWNFTDREIEEHSEINGILLISLPKIKMNMFQMRKINIIFYQYQYVHI